jgi:hypothetical protein
VGAQKEVCVSLHAFAKRHRKTFAVTELGLLVAAFAMLATVVVVLAFAGSGPRRAQVVDAESVLVRGWRRC